MIFMRIGLILFFIISNLALALPQAQGQQESLQQYISRQAKEINSAGSDFKGLTFLDTLLKDKRIIMLGESSHGTEEYSQTKFQLIRYLHERLGFNVLLFESPMMPSAYVNIAKDSATAAGLLQNSIQWVWHTKTVEQLFNYIKTSKLFFEGFDPQLIPSPYSSLLITHAFANYPEIKEVLLQLENRIRGAFKTPKKYLALKDSFSTAYAAVTKQLEKLNLSPLQQWIRQMIVTNTRYYTRIKDGDQRDSCMANNIIWLAENLYLNEKIIVWAHNMHIDKNATSPKRLMGKLLSGHFKEQLYSIGFYMINGTTALNNREIITIKKPVKGSLEDLLGATGFQTAFIETLNPVFNRKIMTLHWGKDKQPMNLFKSYDAVVLINGVTAPEYLP